MGSGRWAATLIVMAIFDVDEGKIKNRHSLSTSSAATATADTTLPAEVSLPRLMISKLTNNSKTLLHKLLFFSSHKSELLPFNKSPAANSYTQVRNYVDVYMKWKKDSYLDSIDSIHKSLQLKPIISIKNFFISSSTSPQDNYSIPISSVSKKGENFGIKIKVARFLRSYPSFFEEFEGPLYNLPWFRLSKKAIDLDKQERIVCEEFRDEILGRLKKVILMGGSRKVLPLKVIKGLQWYLGLPEEFWRDPLSYIGEFGSFEVVEMEDGLKGLAVVDENDDQENKILSVMQKNAMKRGVYRGNGEEPIAFPLYPSKGLRLKEKIKDWLDDFQKLPYISPYDDFSCLNPDSDLSEKRVVGLIHELLSLFVEHSAERKSFLCLRKYLGLPQKVHKAFERHPYMFYLSLKNKTCTAILKEAYCDEILEPHPLAKVRKEYIDLMMESDAILRNRRMNRNKNRAFDDQENVCFGNSSFTDDERFQLAEAKLKV